MKLDGLIDDEIMRAVRAITDPEWNSGRKEIVAYRDAVLRAQNRFCAYCQRPVHRNEVGFRELDHVLPKSQRPRDNLNPVRAASNLREDRRHTTGYPAFRYVPENLVIACKRCNSFKGSYDALADRAAPPAAYPNHTDDFEWVHPYYDEYFEHIDFIEEQLYTTIGGSDKGAAVIHACGLDRAEELTQRLLDSYVETARELVQGMVSLVFSFEPFDGKAVAQGFFERFNVASPETIESCLRDLQGAVVEGGAVLINVMQSIVVELGAPGPIRPVQAAA